MISIPCAARSKKAQPVMACVEKTAKLMSVSPDRVATTMSLFFEELVYLVEQGMPVRVPGFGIFGQNLGKGQDGKRNTHYAAFSASRAWRNELFGWSSARPENAKLGGRRPPNSRAWHHPDWRKRRADKLDAANPPPRKRRLPMLPLPPLF